MKLSKAITLAALVCASSSVLANNDDSVSEYAYSLKNDGIKHGYDASVQGAIEVLDSLNMNGVNVTLSGWSNGNGSSVYRVADNKIIGYTNSQGVTGYGITNNDENPNTPDHATDNIGEGFDFFLLSFDTDVTLNSADFSWLNNWNWSTRKDQQVSVAGLNSTGLSTLTSGSNTWSTIAGAALASGSFDIANSKSSGVYKSENFGFSETAQYWLVGTYNTYFGSVNGASLYNDAFKLSAVNFSKTNTKPKPGPDPVSAPGSLALLLSGMALIAIRRRQK